MQRRPPARRRQLSWLRARVCCYDCYRAFGLLVLDRLRLPTKTRVCQSVPLSLGRPHSRWTRSHSLFGLLCFALLCAPQRCAALRSTTTYVALICTGARYLNLSTGGYRTADSLLSFAVAASAHIAHALSFSSLPLARSPAHLTCPRLSQDEQS